MTSPAVVILTDPARCQLADADTLVKALLQVQHLNQAGVPASQAFCDHPAAAMQFIDAYSKAYPELQQQSSDLPLPQDLYSMVADGRLSPLQAPGGPENAKLEETGQLYPLYVLSLGTPETLMRALQHNGLVKSNIRVLEIAPIEPSETDPVSVADAVAAEPVAPSWVTEDESAPERGVEDALRSEPLAENESVRLVSVEVDLDRIRVDQSNDREDHDAVDQPLDNPAPVIVGTGPAGPETSTPGVARSTSAETPANSVSVADAASQAAAPLTPTPEPIPETHLPSPTEPTTGSGAAPTDQLPADPEPPADVGTDPPPEPAPGDGGPGDPPDGAPEDPDLASGSGGEDGAGQPDAESVPDPVDDALSGPMIPAGVEGDDFADRSWSFALPGEDVHYPPTGSFASDDDLPYALPDDHGTAAGMLDSFFETAGHAEVVDIEAMYGGLADSAAVSAAALTDFDFILTPPPKPGHADSNGSPASDTDWGSAAKRYHDGPEADHDEADDQALTTIHDVDI